MPLPEPPEAFTWMGVPMTLTSTVFVMDSFFWLAAAVAEALGTKPMAAISDTLIAAEANLRKRARR